MKVWAEIGDQHYLDQDLMTRLWNKADIIFFSSRYVDKIHNTASKAYTDNVLRPLMQKAGFLKYKEIHYEL